MRCSLIFCNFSAFFRRFFRMQIMFVSGTSHCRYLYEVLPVCS